MTGLFDTLQHQPLPVIFLIGGGSIFFILLGFNALQRGRGGKTTEAGVVGVLLGMAGMVASALILLQRAGIAAMLFFNDLAAFVGDEFTAIPLPSFLKYFGSSGIQGVDKKKRARPSKSSHRRWNKVETFLMP